MKRKSCLNVRMKGFDKNTGGVYVSSAPYLIP